MIKTIDILEVNPDNSLSLQFEYEVLYGEAHKGVKYELLVFIEDKEISSYMIIEPGFGELEDMELSESDFKSLNSFLYENNYVSYNDEDLVIENYDYLH
jgi:hypothetical protein